MIDNNQKPLFEYSDLELKSIGFDLLELIEVGWRRGLQC